MSVTHLHDWRFGRDGDVEAGIEGSRPGRSRLDFEYRYGVAGTGYTPGSR